MRERKTTSGAPSQWENVEACPACECRQGHILSQEDVASVVRCSRCALVYLDRFPSMRDLKTKFEDTYIMSRDRLQRRFEKDRSAALDYIARRVRDHNPAGGNLLDVGSAGGSFLLRLRDDARWQCLGVEPSKFARQVAVEEYGLQVRQGFLKDQRFADDYFDVITCLDTFYFVPSPRDEILEMARIVKPGGLIFIEVPNLDYRVIKDRGLLSRLLYARESYFHQGAHLTFFNQASLSYLMRWAGLDVIAVYLIPPMLIGKQPHDLVTTGFYYLARMLYWASGYRIDLASKFMVVARKPRDIVSQQETGLCK